MSSACLSHTPLQKRRERQRVAEDTELRREDPNTESTAELHKARPVLQRSRPKAEKWPDAETLDAIAKQLEARPFALEDPCVGDDCLRASLDRVFAKLEKLEDSGQGNVRVLHLGDSHIAADYITSTARKELQYRFNNAGRGFVMVDQRQEYGGRRVKKNGWRRRRAVDQGHATETFGFAAISLESTRSGATVEYKIDPEDAQVTIYYQTQRTGARLDVSSGDTVVGQIDTKAKDTQILAKSFRLPGEGSPRRLILTADGAGIKIVGLSFETGKPGLFYDAVGPVGADARVYIRLDRKSFREHIRALAPDLIVVMLGGNDALAMRKGIRTLDDVRTDYERIIGALRDASPEADCMIWSPMDAAEIVDGKMTSKKFLSEVRNMQKAAATKMGCAFWDMFASMGSEGSFARWHRAGIMNDDLVHPRSAAGELLGHLFATSFLEAYSGGE